MKPSVSGLEVVARSISMTRSSVPICTDRGTTLVVSFLREAVYDVVATAQAVALGSDGLVIGWWVSEEPEKGSFEMVP